jgi:uncharacterized membrane protein AbrB (regulator of aidB expression)
VTTRRRTVRSWVILAALAAIAAAAVTGSVPGRWLAGVFALACCLFLVALDGLRKRTRR